MPGPSASPNVSPAVHSPVNTPACRRPVRTVSYAMQSGSMASANTCWPAYPTPITATTA